MHGRMQKGPSMSELEREGEIWKSVKCIDSPTPQGPWEDIRESALAGRLSIEERAGKNNADIWRTFEENGRRQRGSAAEHRPAHPGYGPPPDETYEQRLQREAAEAEAKRISDEIDEQLRKEREADRRKRKPVKLLLLGQSESGKTATLKNFQLTYARREWYEEKAAWRTVIFLNLVRNVNEILSHLSSEMSDMPYGPDDSSEDLSIRPRALPPITFSEKHRNLRAHLAPLTNVQLALEARLGHASLELQSTSVNTAAAFEFSAQTGGGAGSHRERRALQEFSINSSNGWKTALDRFRTKNPSVNGKQESGNSSPTTPTSTSRNNGKAKETEDDVVEVIASCREDIKTLWEDNIVGEALNRRKVRLEDGPGFFINDADRIANRDYQPTDDDVIRARLRTLGVQEYKFIFDHGRTMGQEWRLYDVGGTRSSRAAWYPYFDDVDAIIFLAPISPFDEKLAEDRRVNRLEDSYLLWRSVCSCKLLSRTQIILFLNKCDLLQAKLQRGVRIRDSVPSFGDRKNDLQTATRYFQQHFKEIARNHSPVQRPFYVHLTSVIDTRSTAVTLGAVEESILREHLRLADLM
ncbi:guanine nucleotide binding protein, alpha subunit [Gymnopilus junonius]|uniref:Guanine nucleotide binding protein, alpha subunit n=1 Tax=Gymnopilus junonius TaxID=109634 RepID=A0A9P5TM10_GYMJU|nr:guanine nucleotide binding protein, alpha subunit [Gymnopilus junonius]